jgi:6-phosphogluconolactonase (cycloisomerase 2 family)
MFVANQDSDTINLFTVDPASGRLTATSRSLKVPSPVCLVFVPLS